MNRDRGPSIAAGHDADLQSVPDILFDVVIIGGGINGAAIAREAARRGHSVLLLEKHDFGWGTTWRSSKLIHGGLRYLEYGELGLVFEALRDQATLLREYPGMVRPLSFVLPVYRRNRHRPAAIDVGLTLYDLLARSRGLPSHRRLAPAHALQVEPALRRGDLTRAFVYYDSQAAYPERLCITTVLEACEAGAIALNHTEAVELVESDGRVTGVRARSDPAEMCRELRGRLVVNAAGPWVDGLLRRLDHPPRPQLGGTKGAHVLVDYHGRGPLEPIYAEARSDHRPFFVIPWRNRHLVGTTDTPFDGDPDTVRATAGDVAYLVSEARYLLPGLPLPDDDVLYAYAGVRPLPASDGEAAGAITRRHIIRDHAGDGHAGLLTVIGGKLSTFRSLATQMAGRIEVAIGPARGHRTWSTTAGGLPRYGLHSVAASRRIGPALLDYLRRLYGPRLDRFLLLLGERPELLTPLCPHGPDVAGQVVFAARYEQARGLGDALLRRTGAGWNPCHALDASRRAATLMAAELGWESARIDREVRTYAAEVRRTFTDLGAARFATYGTEL